MIRLSFLIAIFTSISFSQISSLNNSDINAVSRANNFFEADEMGNRFGSNFSLTGSSASHSAIDSKSTSQQDLLGLQIQQKDMKSSPYGSVKAQVYLDNVIDSSSYIIGPGDVFFVNIWGLDKKSFYLDVDVEGNVFVPACGMVQVKNLCLTDARKRINLKLAEIYKGVSVSTSLFEMKEFKVPVYGEVFTPGSYIANGAMRIMDLLGNAGGLTVKANRRDIRISNLNTNDTIIIDLVKTQNTFNSENNPYLKLGDQIFVTPRKDIISIDGSVCYPGIYDYKSEESLKDLIALCGGFTRSADSSRINVVRYLNDFDSISRFVVSFENMSSFIVMKDDRICVASRNDYRANFSVFIKGEVNYPGNYPIRFRKTTISDVIDLAGGLTENANLINGRIIRTNVQYPGEREYQRVQKMNGDFHTYTDKKYLFSKSTEVGNIVSVNFEDVLKDGKSKVSEMILESGDTIIIPKKYETIKIIGSVCNQGILQYEPEKNVRFYVSRAGGYARRADIKSVKIIKNRNEQMMDPEDTSIEPGDLIWVPEKLHFNRIRIVKEVVLFLGSVATVLISVIAIKNEL